MINFERLQRWLNGICFMMSIKQVSKGKSIPELCDLVLTGYGKFLEPLQDRDELVRFIERVDRMKPKVVVEIGTAKGGTLFLLSRSAAEDATLISIDLQGGKGGGGYSKSKERVFAAMVGQQQSLYCVRGDSHAPESLNKVEKILAGRKVDVLFIDGDHSYEGVKKDFLLYRHLVGPKGIIVFHDIMQNVDDLDNNVFRFWNEMRSQFKSEEIINNREQGRFGIGVLSNLSNP